LLSHTAKKRFAVTRLVSTQNKKIENMPHLLGDMAGLIKTSKQARKQESKKEELKGIGTEMGQQQQQLCRLRLTPCLGVL